jgi:hypothetical protein
MYQSRRGKVTYGKLEIEAEVKYIQKIQTMNHQSENKKIRETQSRMISSAKFRFIAPRLCFLRAPASRPATLPFNIAMEF